MESSRGSGIGPVGDKFGLTTDEIIKREQLKRTVFENFYQEETAKTKQLLLVERSPNLG